MSVKDKSILCIDLYKKIIDERWQDEIMWVSEEDLYNLSGVYPSIRGIICIPYYMTKQLLESLPNLEWIQFTGAGYDTADMVEVKKRNLIVCNSKSVMSESIAEDVFCKMLYFARRIADMRYSQLSKKWESFGQHQWLGHVYMDLLGKTISIIGDGSIANEIAIRAKAFGMRTLVYGRTKKDNKYYDEFVTGEEGLLKLAKEGQFVVCALPSTPDTYHILGKEFFDNMKKTAWFINIARGAIVNEAELIQQLKDRNIAGAGLDVFEQEPLNKESELWELDNVYLTPHKSGMGESWILKIQKLLNDNIDGFLKDKELSNLVRY